MPFSLVHRLLHPLAPRTAGLGASVRAEVRPPLAHHRAPRWRRQLVAWLSSGLGERSASTSFDDWNPAAHHSTELVDARLAFRTALEGIVTPPARICLDHIRAARSLHELWHLRAEVFSLVSRHHSQREADCRLGLVDRHFPSRTRRGAAAGGSARDNHETLPPL